MKKNIYIVAAAFAVLLTLLPSTPVQCNTPARLHTESEGVIDSSIIAQNDSMLSELPDGVNNLLAEDGWRIYLTDKNLNRTYFNDTYKHPISGITFTDPDRILIKAHPAAIEHSCLHEVGHAFDIHFGIISSGPDFTAIYNEEKNTFQPSDETGTRHELSSTAEFFAGVFQDCIESPDTCRGTAPNAYVYIRTMIDNVESQYERNRVAEVLPNK